KEVQRGSIGFLRGSESTADRKRKKSAVEDALKQTFRPEFLNRIDEIIIFDELTEEQLHQIVELMLGDMEERLAERGIGVSLTPEAKSWLAKEGFDRLFGARPLRRTIQRFVENPLSKRILQGEFREGDTVLVGLDPTGLVFTRTRSRKRRKKGSASKAM
ncbi:MAG: hypothetical protein FJZ95_10245, partial [Chloroflexi bacterium]|nr:hypothetical protein [Chloroflexota bacterium]